MNPQNLDKVIITAAQLGVALYLQQRGEDAGEISERQAVKVYGTWFRRAVEQGRIRPHFSGDSKNSKKLYNVPEILALKASDQVQAQLILK